MTLTPTFNKNTASYTAATTNASDKVTATATDSKATITVLSDDATIASDGTATWAPGSNEVVIAVSRGGFTKAYTVTVTAPVPDTSLSALTVGALTLTPTFDSDTTEYAVATSNATNKITATATDNEATVVIASEDATIAQDGTATWADGENTVTITVSLDGESTVYTVVVTKS